MPIFVVLTSNQKKVFPNFYIGTNFNYLTSIIIIDERLIPANGSKKLLIYNDLNKKNFDLGFQIGVGLTANTKIGKLNFDIFFNHGFTNIVTTTGSKNQIISFGISYLGKEFRWSEGLFLY